MLALVCGLFVAGVLLFADSLVVGGIGWVGTLILLIAIGFADGHLRAVAWAVVFLASALAADVLWLLEFAPFDRDADYEPIPQSPFILIALPIPMALIAIGVGIRWVWRRLSRIRPTWRAARVFPGDTTHHPMEGEAACPASRTRAASGATRSSASPPRTFLATASLAVAQINRTRDGSPGGAEQPNLDHAPMWPARRKHHQDPERAKHHERGQLGPKLQGAVTQVVVPPGARQLVKVLFTAGDRLRPRAAPPTSATSAPSTAQGRAGTPTARTSRRWTQRTAGAAAARL